MANKDPIRVGVLYSETGVTSMIGRSQMQGALLAVDEINQAGGINGRELVPVRYDGQSSPLVYATLAEQLIVQDKVNVIFGCYMSSSRKAVLPIVEKWNKLLFYPTLYEGFEFSNNIIYTGAAPNQNSVQLAEFMTTNFGASVYLIGSNYIYPYESNRIMSDLILQHPNSRKLGERYVALDASEKDFQPIIADIHNQRPDFIFSTVVGDSTASLYQVYAESGLDPKTMPIASLTTSEGEISQMGADVALGHFTAAPYFHSINSDTNKRFTEPLANSSVPPASPICTWKPHTFKCISMPTHIGIRGTTKSAGSCLTFSEASLKRRRVGCASTQRTTTRRCIRASA